MKGKLNNAWKNIRKERYEEQRLWRTIKGILREKNKVENYNNI